MRTLESLVEELEPIVDASSVSAILEALSDICHLKADHIKTNWQDLAMARQWTIAGVECNKAQDRVNRKAGV